MPIETDSNEKVTKLAEMGNNEALFELGIRHLGGLFENTQDTKKAKNFLEKAKAAGNTKAGKILSSIEGKDAGEEELPMLLTAVAEYYRDLTLENDQNPVKKDEAALQKKLSLYWYYSATAHSYLPGLYSLAEFYYMLGGPQDNECAAVMYCVCAGIEGEYADKAVERLHNMLTRGWLSETWNCYSDVLYILENYSEHDISEYSDAYDENTEVDDITSDKLFATPAEYPLEAEKNAVRRYGRISKDRDLYTVLLSMGIPSKKNPNGNCKIAFKGNEENVERLKSMGYKVVEGATGYIVHDKKKK